MHLQLHRHESCGSRGVRMAATLETQTPAPMSPSCDVLALTLSAQSAVKKDYFIQVSSSKAESLLRMYPVPQCPEYCTMIHFDSTATSRSQSVQVYIYPRPSIAVIPSEICTGNPHPPHTNQIRQSFRTIFIQPKFTCSSQRYWQLVDNTKHYRLIFLYILNRCFHMRLG